MSIASWFIESDYFYSRFRQRTYSNLVEENSQHEQNPSNLQTASTFGWTLSTTIRIPNALETAAYAPFNLYRDGAVSWDLAFGSDADGDPIVLLPDGGGGYPNYTGLSYTLQGVGSTYHTYDLVYNPSSGTADLFVDGIERLSNYAGIPFASTTGNTGWGSGSSIDTGQGNFNSVQFSVAAVPVPAAVWLFGSGLVGLFGAARRKVRK